MISDLDVYRSAKVLIDKYGAVEAEIHAAQRADALLKTGVLDGRRVWLRVLDAVIVKNDAERRYSLGASIGCRGYQPNDAQNLWIRSPEGLLLGAKQT